ncbi:diguanylate cyclase [Roseibium hamelinense]|nr:diguanylate cyclase [Roseibium hamelinense]
MSDASIVISRVLQNTAATVVESLNTTVSFTVSAGVCELKHNETAKAFLHRADQNLYVAKNSGRNCFINDTDLAA